MRSNIYPAVFGAILSTTITGLPNGQFYKALGSRAAPDTVPDQINNCIVNPYAAKPGEMIESCEPKYKLNDDGSCWIEGDDKHQLDMGNPGRCAYFCQTSVTANYGPEAPYSSSTCECSDSECSISNTQTTTVSHAIAFDVGFNLKKRDLGPRDDVKKPPLGLSDLLNVFNAGASWSWSESYANATNIGHKKPKIDEKKCGYWTFVPYYVTICGTLTWAQAIPFNAVGTGGTCGSRQNIEDWCQQMPMTGPNGEPLGKTVFVATNCYTQAILPFCWQNPAYCFDGVSTNKSLAEDFRNAHRDYDIEKEILSSVRYWCEHNLPGTGYTEGETPSGCKPGLPPGIGSIPL